jgi:hypothetical protein
MGHVPFIGPQDSGGSSNRHGDREPALSESLALSEVERVEWVNRLSLKKSVTTSLLIRSSPLKRAH